MNSDDYISSEFNKYFEKFSKRNIALYGIGQYTKLILDRFSSTYNFIGLLDRRQTGKIIYGMPVLSQEDVLKKKIEIIIIISNLSIAPEIYSRIMGFVREHNIDVYYMNGLKAQQTENICKLPHDSISKELFLTTAMKYDVISFDLFDTLIMRICVKPEEVFEVIAEQIFKDQQERKEFVSARLQAEIVLYHEVNKWYNLEDIYNYLSDKYSKDIINMLYQLEMETEDLVIVPRWDVLECFQKLVSAGKEVVICTDMYMTEKQLRGIVEKFGITPKSWYISSQCKASKHDGRIYDLVKTKYYGKTILHIGDNYESDYTNAREHGLDSVWIPSAMQINESYKAFSYDKFSAPIISSAFNSPFLEGEGKKIDIPDEEKYGYIFWGPLVLGYLIFLHQFAVQNKIEYILALSRDGYILELGQKVLKEAGLWSDKIKMPYFYTSRQVAGVCAIREEKDIAFFIDKMCNRADITLKYILEDIMGINISSRDVVLNKSIRELGKKESIRYLIENYGELILHIAKKKRKCYWKYINKSNINWNEKVAIVNFVGRGITQKCLQQIIGRKLIGVYLAAEVDITEILPDSEYEMFFPELISTHVTRKNYGRYYLYGENVFSAPNGQLRDFDQHGNPIFYEVDINKEKFVRKCHNGIIKYIKDVMLLNPDMMSKKMNLGILDHNLGEFMDSKFKILENIKGNKFEDNFEKY